MDVFDSVIEEMESSRSITTKPYNFPYLAKLSGKGYGKTWSYISVDNIGRLKLSLRDRNIMVFRLGRRDERSGTWFGLAKCRIGLSDYFLIDDNLLRGVDVETYPLLKGTVGLDVFKLLPKLTEKSLVNLAIVSGLINSALGIKRGGLSIPATVQSNFSFEVKARSDQESSWLHNNGQVEIDAMFMGNRGGEDVLFVVEAKSGKPDSLAKHKLIYPVTAIRSSVPNNLKVIPVYLRIWPEKDGMHFMVAECEDSCSYPCVVESLKASNVSHYVIHKLCD